MSAAFLSMNTRMQFESQEWLTSARVGYIADPILAHLKGSTKPTSSLKVVPSKGCASISRWNGWEL